MEIHQRHREAAAEWLEGHGLDASAEEVRHNGRLVLPYAKSLVRAFARFEQQLLAGREG